MLFNSLTFFVFFSIVLVLYLSFQGRLQLQNRMLLVASYVFYGWWDWRFLSLIWLSTAVDYFCGLMIGKTDRVGKRKFFLILSVCFNLVVLGFFKYFNFFSDGIEKVIHCFGFQAHPLTLQIILPVAVSFYTFQEISYIVDVYRRQINPVKKFLDYALFVAFFPQLMAGPINRATDLLPQILQPRKLSLDMFYEGCYLIFWGLYKKMFVADSLAKIVSSVFLEPPPYNGVRVLLGVYAFAFQIYCDFSGYTDMARGLAKILGFDLTLNFNLPYFATNPSDFWRRWHMSLSTWLRDYLYVPLGGNRKGVLRTYCNLMLTMVLGGLWHGANWTFVLWGAYHGFLLCAYKFMEPYVAALPKIKNRFLEKIWFGIRVILFFHLICLGWLFFRADSMTQIFEMLKAICLQFDIVPHLQLRGSLKSLFFFTFLLVAIQLFQCFKKDLMIVYHSNILFKTALYAVMFYSIFLYGMTTGTEFIYFKF